jgi:hypothetical protein
MVILREKMLNFYQTIMFHEREIEKISGLNIYEVYGTTL